MSFLPRAFLVSAALVLALALASPAEAANPSENPPPDTAKGWVWPVDAPVIVRAFHAPTHAYGPGHRGIDLASGSAQLRAPAEGVIAFAGSVAGRGVLTIDHGDGLVTTLEPIETPLTAADRVPRGVEVGRIVAGGHTAPGTVHFGVRRDGEYINPLLLLGGVPRAVLLPCC